MKCGLRIADCELPHGGRVLIWTALAACLMLAVPAAGQDDVLLGVPGAPPTRVDARGVVHEDWGAAELRLELPEGAQLVSQQYDVAPAPTVTTKTTAGSVTLSETVYRAPLWPTPMDVLCAVLENAGYDEATARLCVTLPEKANTSGGAGLMGSRRVIGLPPDVRPARRNPKSWGCTGGASPLPGWAKPQGECDPAFRNISAGMGGVPIAYCFSVAPGEARTVVLGFCESHWSMAGRRPLEIYVEGTPKSEIDPVAEWGQHVPRCLMFGARDENGDGLLDITIAPHPKATDKNTILNAIWVFKLDTPVVLDEVLRGAKSGEAEYYVDVGGENDQLFCEEGPIEYEVTLAPGERKELTFLLACAGGGVQILADTAWTPATMRTAAEEVWRDWFAQAEDGHLLEDSAKATRQALAKIVLCCAEADGYYVALPTPGDVGQFSQARAAEMIAALDAEGLHDEARRLVRVYWEKPVPEPFAAVAQGEDGQWQDAVKDPCAHGIALQALTGHALATLDAAWASDVWPALAAGAKWLANPETQAALSPEAKKAAAAGLDAVAHVAELLKREDASQFQTLARALAPES